MIKRRFYKQDHGNKSASDSSSSDDSEFDPKVEVEEGHQVEVDEYEVEGRVNDDKALRYPSPGSGYESEDSSNNQEESDASGLLTNEDDGNDGEYLHCNKDSKTISKVVNENEGLPGISEIARDLNDPFQADTSNFILKHKSVFKCRLCPRVLCLNEVTLRAHLASKRHARSKKLFGEGRLKLMLNSDGEIVEELETHAERHARILALAQEHAVLETKRKKTSGGQRKNHRREKKRMRSCSNKGNSGASVEGAANKKRRSLD